MKEDNGQHRDGAQALDVLAKFRLCRSPTLHPFDKANAVGLAQGHHLVRGRVLRVEAFLHFGSTEWSDFSKSRIWGMRLSRPQSNPLARRGPLTVAVMFYGTAWCVCVIAWLERQFGLLADPFKQ